MKPRNVCAAELQQLLEQLHGLVERGEALARSSGMVVPSRFGAMRAAIMLAAGDLDQKGLLEGRPKAEEPKEVAP